MCNFRVLSGGFFLSVLCMLLLILPAVSQQGGQQQPAFKAVAETKLIMQGVTFPNFEGMERLLKEQPANVQSWAFVRGQALLVAETGNLLMLRPPRGNGKNVWFSDAAKMRETATELARAAAKKDYVKSRTLLVNLANRCNSCHTTFRVKKEIVPFAKK